MNRYQNISKIKIEKFSLLVLVGICLSSIFIMYSDIQKPGLYYDDADHPAVALQILKDDPTSRYWSVSSVQLFGHTLPLWGDYEGTVTTYTILPFVALFGSTMEAIRIYGIVIVISTTIFTYLFGREAFNEKVGLFSAALFALAPSIVFMGKTPANVNFIMALLTVTSLYFLLKWKNSGKTRFMILGFFSLGLGISTKVTFWWVPFVLIISLIAFRPKFKLNVKRLVLASVFLILGSSIWWTAFAIGHDWFLRFFSSRLTSTPLGASNVSILSNLLERINDFFQLLSANHFDYLGGMHQNLLVPIFFVISVVGIFIIRIKGPNHYFRKLIFLIFFISVVLLISTVTISTRNFWQLLILFPLVSVIMSAFTVHLFEILKKKETNKYISCTFIVSIIILLISSNLIVIGQYKNDLNKTDGTGFFSIQFNNLTDYLLKNNFTNVVALDWGFTRDVYYLSDAKIIPIEDVVYPGENFDLFKTNLQTYIKNPNTIYLKYYEDTPVNGSSISLQEIVKQDNKKLVLLKTFKDWDGSNLIYVYKIE